MLTAPSSYNDLIQRCGLSVIAKGGDLDLTSDNDVSLTKDGDWKLGSTAHNAMFRLTEAWRLNGPALRLMYEAVRELRAKEAALESDIEQALKRAFEPWRSGGTLDTTDYHLANDESGAATIGRGALAGSLMIVAASLLARFKSDAEATDAEWQNTPPLTNAISTGALVVAAANSFRHHDEWIKARFAGTLGKQQMNSIRPLTQALGLQVGDLFGDVNACERVTFLLGEESFDQLECAVLGYANAVAVQVETRA